MFTAHVNILELFKQTVAMYSNNADTLPGECTHTSLDAWEGSKFYDMEYLVL